MGKGGPAREDTGFWKLCGSQGRGLLGPHMWVSAYPKPGQSCKQAEKLLIGLWKNEKRPPICTCRTSERVPRLPCYIQSYTLARGVLPLNFHLDTRFSGNPFVPVSSVCTCGWRKPMVPTRRSAGTTFARMNKKKVKQQLRISELHFFVSGDARGFSARSDSTFQVLEEYFLPFFACYSCCAGYRYDILSSALPPRFNCR